MIELADRTQTAFIIELIECKRSNASKTLSHADLKTLKSSIKTQVRR